MEWQTGEYERNASFNFIIPYQFLLLCKLMNVTPKQMLTDFMDNLSCGSWKREGRDTAKARLIDYFIEHGYGQHKYSTEDIRIIFKELDALGLLWPTGASQELLELSTIFRTKYLEYWFGRWENKTKYV